MPTYSIPYGQTHTTFFLDDQLSADVILPPVTSSLTQVEIDQKIDQALSHPLGGIPLDAFRDAKSVAIAVNDKTRPVPYRIMLPPLLARLDQIGIDQGAIKLYIATGTHTPMPPEEFLRILPQEVIDKYTVVSHDCDDSNNQTRLGITSRGTELDVNRAFFQSDLKIVTGNIEPHHFAGFSGGAKTAAIGLGARSTINTNHSMLVDPNSMIGIYENNPLRQDIEEMGDMIGAHYALNFILSGEHEVADVLFGQPRLVMQQGIPIARQICQTRVRGTYDLVIASAGGHPKDINLYQAQKAMTHASLMTRKGGMIILAAACPEGPGSASYEAYVQGISSQQDILDKFQKDGFKVGPHKSFQIARLLLNYKFILVSNMDQERVRRLLIDPDDNLQRAVDRSLRILPSQSAIAVLPHATSTIPMM